MKMKKYILILFSILSLCSCTEDNTVDITVMPPATTTGADTFGCLVDDLCRRTILGLAPFTVMDTRFILLLQKRRRG